MEAKNSFYSTSDEFAAMKLRKKSLGLIPIDNNRKVKQLTGLGDFRLSYLDRRSFSDPALRAFFRIAKIWKLNVKEEMRLLEIKSYKELGQRKRLEIVLTSLELQMISWVLNIYKNLHILLPNGEAADTWMKRRQNGKSPFGRKSAMEYIMEADMYLERILSVRNYLESQLH